MTSANAGDILGNGAASYDAATNTLTVSGDISVTGGSYNAIQSETDADFKIVVTDDVTISSQYESGIYHSGSGSLAIEAEAFDIEAGYHGIHARQSLTVDCTTLSIVAETGKGIGSNYGSVSISAEDAFIEGCTYGIVADGSIALAGGSFEIKSLSSGSYDESYSALCYGSLTVAEGMIVTAAEEPDGTFASYVPEQNDTYDHVKIAPELETHDVTFDSKGGFAVAAQTVEDGGKVEKPADPTKEGYDFAGWTFEGKAWDFDSNTVTGDITLVAEWKEKDADGNGGSESDQPTNPEGDEPKKPEPNDGDKSDKEDVIAQTGDDAPFAGLFAAVVAAGIAVLALRRRVA